MAYKILSSTPQKLVLERESAAMAAGCFMAVGSLFFIIGVGLNYFMTSWEMPFLLFKILFPIFGLGAVAAGYYLPRQMRETQPARITFDHEQGAVVIEMNDGNDQKGFIRYDEMNGFDVYVESRSSSSSSRGTSRTTYHYHVYLKKKDGGEWHLFEYGNRADADAMIVQLNAQIPSERPFKLTMPTKLSPKIERKEGLDKTVIHWQNKVALGHVLFLIVFAAIFLSIIFGFFTFGTQLDVFFMIVIGFILTIFLLVMVSVVRKLIKDATTRYAVSVDHANLEYYEFAKSTGAMRNKKILPLVDVRSISYTFAPSKQYQNAGLRILTRKDEEKIEEYRQKPLQALKDLFSSKDSPITLSITALNPVECLQLENWLQELILKKGNVKVQ